MEQIENISHFPNRVIDFSSHYGSDRQDSAYSAGQLVGKPRVYPRYGDFSTACVLRYYGTWWSRAPSAARTVGKRPDCYPADYLSQDFVQVEYPSAIRLQSVRVYETFVPGCVVRIYARAAGGRWLLVWRSNKPPVALPHKARVFEPQLLCCPLAPVRQLRLEFNSNAAEYYTELDTIEIVGLQAPDARPASVELSVGAGLIGSRPWTVANDAADRTELASSSRSAAAAFGRCPPEVVVSIAERLDLVSLVALGSTCRLLRTFCYDPLLYRSLSLRPYCLRVSDASLYGLMSRATALRELDLSWCGGDQRVTPAGFCEFLHNIEPDCLRVLRLANCRFLDDGCLRLIGVHCKALSDLDMSGCKDPVTGEGFNSLSRLHRLERINFYRCGVPTQSLLAIIRSNKRLRHLNLGSCEQLDKCDAVAAELARCCPDLRSVDFWRSRSLTHEGLVQLAQFCKQLQELDLGWCMGVKSGSGCFCALARGCNQLRKLFLTANRSVTDSDLRAIAGHCRQLQQLDILGTNNVSFEAMSDVLRACPKLEMFDVSFCSAANKEKVQTMRKNFPHCAIQMSFQSEGAADAD